MQGILQKQSVFHYNYFYTFHNTGIAADNLNGYAKLN
jgi:hypothetical protein